MRDAAVLLAFAVWATQVHAQAQPRPGTLSPQIDASQLLAQISKIGPYRAFDAWLKNGTFDRVLNGIETGETGWLRVAVAIHPATDAGNSEMLSLAAGIALAKHPATVLSIWGGHNGVDGVCGYPDLSDPKTDTPQKATAYIDARLRAVGTLHTPLAQECIKVLKRTREEILSKNGPFS